MAAIEWAWKQGLRPGPMLVLQCLAWHARPGDWLAYPGIKTIAKETGFSTRAVGLHLDALENDTLIKRERRHLTKGAAKGKRLSDTFILIKGSAALSENTAHSVSENSTDRAEGASRRLRQPYPKNLQTLPADSSSGYIRNEPREEPTSEPTGDQAAGRDDDEKIKRLRDDPLTRGKAELIFEAFGIAAISHSEIRSLSRGIATLEAQNEDAFEFYIVPFIKELIRKGERPNALNFHWMMTEVASAVRNGEEIREEFRRELRALRAR